MATIGQSGTPYKKYSFHNPNHLAIKWDVNVAKSESVSAGIYFIEKRSGKFLKTPKRFCK